MTSFLFLQTPVSCDVTTSRRKHPSLCSVTTSWCYTDIMFFAIHCAQIVDFWIFPENIGVLQTPKSVNLKTLKFHTAIAETCFCYWTNPPDLDQPNGGFPKFFSNRHVANLPNLPNWPWPMKESINLTGGLLGYVDQHDLFKYIQILNMSNVWHEKFKWLLNTHGFVQFQWLDTNSSLICIQTN